MWVKHTSFRLEVVAAVGERLVKNHKTFRRLIQVGSKLTSVQGNFNGALEGLLTVEKQQRLAEDVTGTKMACKAILELLYDAKQWKLLNENILLLAKRRSQLKQVKPLELVF